MTIETPPQDAAATHSIDDTPFTTILDLLSGEGSDDPDSVLARLPAEHLDRIATAAQRKGQDCLDLARCLVDCTAQLLMRLTPRRRLRPRPSLDAALLSNEHPKASLIRPQASPEREKPSRERKKASLFSLPTALKRSKASLLTHRAALKRQKA